MRAGSTLVVLFSAFLATSVWPESPPVRPVKVKHRPHSANTSAEHLLTSCPVDSFRIIATTLAAANGSMTFGDTDHDGAREIVLAVSTIEEFSWRILEYDKAAGSYVQEFVGPSMDPYAVGDLDRDGKADVLGQPGATLVLYESQDAYSYPMNLVWVSPSMNNVLGYSTVGDTDRDGNLEIIHSRNGGGSRLIIFENTGDNSFALKLNVVADPHQETGPKAIADLDQDGLVEIAFGGTDGYLHIFESPANDVWQQTFVDSTGMINAYGMAGGADTDGNGKPEIFLAGAGPGCNSTYVYEAVADNAFVRRVLLPRCGEAGVPSTCIANTDGVGRPEYVWWLWPRVKAYRANVPGEWAVAAVSPNDPDMNGSHTAVASYDINENGRDEVYWASEGNAVFGNTLVLERAVPCPTDVEAGRRERLSPAFVLVTPTPCRTQASLRLAEPALATRSVSLAAFDVAGRLVLREKAALATPSDIAFPVRSLRPGLYVVRVEDAFGRSLAIARALIVPSRK